MFEGGSAGHDIGKVSPEQMKQVGKESGGGREEDQDQTAHDHGGNEVGQIGDHLKSLLEQPV